MVKPTLFPLALLLVFTALILPAQASSLVAEPDRTQIYEGEVLTLTVQGSLEIDLNLSNLFDLDLTRLPAPDIEQVEPAFEILDRKQRYSVQTINGRMSGQVTWTYQLAPTTTGSLTIPALTFQDAQSEPIRIDVVAGTPPDQPDASRDIFIELSADKAEVYVQEQLVLTVQLFISGNLIRGELSEPEHPDAVIEPLGKQQEFTRYRDGVRYRVVERRYAIFPQQPGQLNLPPLRFEGQTRSPGGQLRFVRDHQQLYEVPVKPVPDTWPANTPWLPASSLALAEDGLPPPGELALGSNLNRKVTLLAGGLPAEALPPLPGQVPAAIRSYPEQALRNTETTGEGLQAALQQSSALVPVQAGEAVIPEIRIPWWNTRTGEPEEAVLPERRYTIIPQAGAAPAARPATPPPSEPVTRPDAGTDVTVPRPETTPLWLWTTLTFALLWLITLALWWRHHRAAVSDRAATETEDSNEAAAFNRLRQAIQRADSDIAGHLVRWARLRFQQERFDSAQDVIRFSSDPDLQARFGKVQARLYAQQQPPESGEERKQLIAALEQLRRHKTGHKDSRHGLPSLHQLS